MIFGIGTDLVQVSRIERVYDKYQDKFASRILTYSESLGLAKTANKANFLAKRFAAKEALAKALGSGVRGFWFTDIEIIHEENGKPGFKFFGPCQQKINQKQISKAYLSITDEQQYAIAFVLLEA